jgi:hypothetical protein
VKQHNKRIHLYPQLLPTFYIKFGAALQFRKKEFKICSQILPKKNLGNLFFFVKNILENEYSIANSHFKKKQGKKWKKNLKQVCNFFTIVYNINKCSRFF